MIEPRFQLLVKATEKEDVDVYEFPVWWRTVAAGSHEAMQAAKRLLGGKMPSLARCAIVVDRRERK
jgi:hypothetical protein